MPLNVYGIKIRPPARGSRQRTTPSTPQSIARQYFSLGFSYLQHSITSVRIINHFHWADEVVNVVVNFHERDHEKNNVFYHPARCRIVGQGCPLHYSITNTPFTIHPPFPVCTGGGCITWYPKRNVKFIEKQSSLNKWKRSRHLTPWKPFDRDPSLFQNFHGTYNNVPLTYQPPSTRIDERPRPFPAPVLLIHEMGHAMQYALDKDDFLEIESANHGKYKRLFPTVQPKSQGPILDLLNVATIENTVCLELRDAGKDVGIRWQYDDVDPGRPTINTSWAN